MTLARDMVSSTHPVWAFFSFSGSQVKSVYVDHVEHVGLALEEGRLEFQGHSDTDTTRVLVVITDKDLNDTVKCE